MIALLINKIADITKCSKLATRTSHFPRPIYNIIDSDDTLYAIQILRQIRKPTKSFRDGDIMFTYARVKIDVDFI